MNSAELLALFEQLTEAPDAIQQLRQWIISLAMHGGLVPQDPSDETASRLMEMIAESKALIANRRSSKKIVGDDQTSIKPPFALPASWCWTTLDAVSSYIQRGKSPKYSTDDGALVISQRCVQWDCLDLSVAKRITFESLRAYEAERFLREGDILWNSTGTGTIGRLIRLREVPPGLVCDSHVTVVRTLIVDPDFIGLWLRSDYVYGVIEEKASGSTNQVELTARMAQGQLLPLPPLAEQHRIVAKVDELMALCDRLEAARKEREAARDRLATVSLGRLNTPDPESFVADARFAIKVVPILTARAAQIRQLRQTILNLAVRGRLVPQKPIHASSKYRSGESVLERERSEHQKAEVAPFHIPAGWSWVQLRAIVARADSGWSPKTTEIPRTGDRWGVLRVSAVSWGKFRGEENKELLPGVEPRLQAQVRRGDFLISRANTAELVARAVVVEEDPTNLMLSDKIVRLQLNNSVNRQFICMVNNSADYARAHYANLATGVSPSMKNVSRDVILDLPIPLPPLEEQCRIVEAVRSTMACCDQLEHAITARDTVRSRLLEGVLYRALSSSEMESPNAATAGHRQQLEC
ncbi:restriction endonuclease subunit S [Gemmatimonas sp.]|uniref:restriction endonuclease subunit S n=1 Tax=Gemmatimonas sp. TaxID=1962908 RepID=UPI0022C44CAC|nr:restriction endonuclease subunit S [Gemmatimonas sp.]MCZ8203727.1 restriction endonuclease subunit S [Gemmatimonas sp.]